MSRASQHTFQVLTKRPERAAELATNLPWPTNVWLGTSVENQDYVWRVRQLANVPAHVRFLSVEPLIGPINRLPLREIHWVIVGGESGPGARPMETKWVTTIRDRCNRYGVPFFFKQWGGVQKSRTGRTLEGRTWDEMPIVNGGTNGTTRKDRWPELCDRVAADDGLPTRSDVGAWTEDKLYYWNRYIEITTNAMVGNPKWQGGIVLCRPLRGSRCLLSARYKQTNSRLSSSCSLGTKAI